MGGCRNEEGGDYRVAWGKTQIPKNSEVDLTAFMYRSVS